MTNIEGFEAGDADPIVTIDRADLETVMMRRERLTTMIEEGVAMATGDVSVLDRLVATMATSTPDFEMAPGTARASPARESNPFQVGAEPVRGE